MLALNFWHNYREYECISFLMSSTAGSNACNPSSSHPTPFWFSTHNYRWWGGALDYHCVYHSCSTLYCSTSWPLMGGKTPNIATYCFHYLTITTTLHHPHNHITQCGFFSRKKHREIRRKRQALTDPTASTENILDAEVEPAHNTINGNKKLYCYIITLQFIDVCSHVVTTLYSLTRFLVIPVLHVIISFMHETLQLYLLNLRS